MSTGEFLSHRSGAYRGGNEGTSSKRVGMEIKKYRTGELVEMLLENGSWVEAVYLKLDTFERKAPDRHKVYDPKNDWICHCEINEIRKKPKY